MITLLHGEYIEASRSELRRLIERAKSTSEIRQLDGGSLDEASLAQAIESLSLFGTPTLVVIERLFAKLGRQQKRIASIAAFIQQSVKDNDIVLWEDKELSAGTVKQLGPGANVRLFKLPMLIFHFLDNLRPGNAKNSLVIYQQLIATEPAELVFSMLAGRVRQLIQLQDNVTPARLAPWQATRLTLQAKSFTMDKLLAMYKKLHDIEVSIKTGVSPISMALKTQQFLTEV